MVVIISFGLGLLVAGETDFNLAGFVIVMVASALSGLRWTITQVLLQGNDAHGTGGCMFFSDAVFSRIDSDSMIMHVHNN